jgi:hypothetical protein
MAIRSETERIRDTAREQCHQAEAMRAKAQQQIEHAIRQAAHMDAVRDRIRRRPPGTR